jgi:hypothetical protein
LQVRLEAMSDEEVNRMVDANITVSGIEVRPFNITSYICTLVWGSILLFPLFFVCCSWWRRCTLPIYEVPASTYAAIGRLLRGSSLRNLTLVVVDNGFDH